MQNKIAIVTGATRLNGIGAAICRELARKGMSVFFTYWTPYEDVIRMKYEKEEPGLLLEKVKKIWGPLRKA